MPSKLRRFGRKAVLIPLVPIAMLAISPRIVSALDPTDGLGGLIPGLITEAAKIEFIGRLLAENLAKPKDGIPVAQPGSVQTPRDRAIPIMLTATHEAKSGSDPNDFANQVLTYTVERPPSNGTLSGQGSALVYTPNPGFTGNDSFEFRVSDGVDGSTTATVTINVRGSFINFDSGQVRPLALSPDKTRLYAVNTPDNRLEIFDVTGATPRPIGSVPVGMEPVAVAVRNNGEVWVVNHLSDSVSIVDVSGGSPRVKRTLLVGDEPRDIVFAGPNRNRAFITTAHRGQNSPVDPQLHTPGVGRADVWVFDADNLGTALNGPPLKVLTLFGDTPRALAVSPDGGTVYAAVLHSGNKTTSIGANDRELGFHSTRNGKPGPQTDASGQKAPNSGVIVKQQGKTLLGTEKWVDERGTDWAYFVRHELPDYDVFAIDAKAASPKQIKSWSGVGTTLFNLAVNPVSGALYVSNTEANNHIRFEGHGDRVSKPTVTANLAASRITVIKGNSVLPRHLNKHINYNVITGPESERKLSLSQPVDMAVSSDGRTLYVAAFGSSKIGVYNTQALEQNTFTPSLSNQIVLSGGGPSGVVLDESRNRLYALTRFNNSVVTVDLATKRETASVPMYSPEPDYVINGRRLLFDAEYTSGHGDASCGSCHIYGDLDHLAWDLGNPDERWVLNPNEYVDQLASRALANRMLHPMKGPMATQSLRGLAFAGPQHWRGDRTGKVRLNGESTESAAFKEFNVAFPGLLGRATELTSEEMQALTDYALSLSYPPNPIRRLDNSLTPAQAEAQHFYLNTPSTGLEGVPLTTCNSCHVLDPNNNHFGTSGKMSFEGLAQAQDMKVPHLRNLYQKVGKFAQSTKTLTTGFMGPQIRGFGFQHGGESGTPGQFLSAEVFHVPSDMMPKLESFLMAFDTGLAPIVGQQVTLSANSGQQVHERIDLLISRAAVKSPLVRTSVLDPRDECDLIVKGRIEGAERGWVRLDDGSFLSDRGDIYGDAELRALAQVPGQELTYTCTPPGSGIRMGVDRDEDGILDGFDHVTSGKAFVSIAPENPYAPPLVKVAEDAAAGGFALEKILRDIRWFPNRPF